MTAISTAFPIFNDIDGQPLEAGYVWIGQPNLDPVTNQKPVYWDDAFTQLATQPIRTRGGYPLNGTLIGQIYTTPNYSIKVTNKNGSILYNVPQVSSDTISVTDFGAVGDGTTDDTAAFTAAGSIAARVQVLVPAGVYRLNSNPAPTGFVTWSVQQGASFVGTGKLRVGSSLGSVLAAANTYKSIESDPAFYDGIFKYLEDNAALTGYGVIGLHGSVKASDSSGAGARIAVAAFGVNDFVGGTIGVWGLYSTVVRQSTATGFTHGMEIDVANMGSTVPIMPAAPFVSGLTSGIWLCTGGETTEPTAGGSPGAASVGLAIIQNDSQTGTKTAKFDKGILFHNAAIAGADGTGGGNIGLAIAFATGHAMQWFNNSNQCTAEIVNTGATFANTGIRLDFSNFGLLVQDRVTGQTLFQVNKVTNSVNGVSILPGITGNAGTLLAIGETNVDLGLQPKGTGLVKFGTWISNADAPIDGYVTIKDAAGNTRKLATIA